ncbi:MAG TPA: GNAT family N-acetyltransferase, partial [Burkholderiaceae bacterium]|nr:GNAT family N-acetyltransferase [Burkholderiaceae bacterium]
MLRHQLNSLFEPRSLLLVGPANLAFMGATLPAALQACTTRLVLEAEETPQLPSQLQGLADKQRLDLAVVCVSPDQLPLLLDALSVFRPRVLVVLSSAQAAADSYELLAFCRSWGLLNDCQVLGPRSFGLQLPHKALNLSHAPQLAGAGRVALVAQSSTLVFALLDWAADVNMGFSAVISLGHEAGISVADVLDYLVSDPHTDSIALYLKETPRIRRLASALRAVAAVKPVVILRPRHRRQGLADRTEDAVFNTLLRRTGAVRVPYFIQLFSALRVLRYKKRPQGPRVVLLSNSRGAAQLALDVIGPGYSISRADLNQSTRHKLQALLAPGSTTESPVISVSPFTPESLSAVVALLMADEGVDGILVLLTPDPLADTDALAKQLIHEAQNGKKPLVSCLLGESSMRSLRQQFDQAQVPVFRTPESAAGAFGILAAHQYNQNLSRQILPPEPLQRPPSLNKARNILNEARSDKRYRLLSDECRQLFQCFSIPIDITVLPKGVAGPPAGFQFASDLPSMAIRVLRSPHIGPYLRFGASGLIGR